MSTVTCTAPFVPSELRALKNWVPWDLKPGKDGRPTKVPRGSTTDPETWRTFEDALAIGAEGVGFCFTDTDYAGCDLDGCLIDGQPTAEARQIIDALASYTERSPSGSGLHIVVKGKLPPGVGHKNVHVPGMKALEAYDTGRYFTWTGHVFEGRDEIHERTEALSTLAGRWLGRASDVRPLTALEAQARLPIVNTHLSNDELLALIEQEQPTMYREYLEKDLPLPRVDLSKDDIVLLRLLIPYTGWDEARIKALAERSALMRDRWSKIHSKGLTWLEYQIRRELVAAAAATVAKTGDELARSYTLAELRRDPDVLKPPTVVVPGLAWQGRVTLVAAREGVGKSTLFSAAAAAVVSGRPFLGEATLKGPVLWVLVEEHVADLFLRAIAFQTAEDGLHVLERPDTPVESLRAEVARIKPVLVIIDTLHTFAATLVERGSQSDDWQTVMSIIDELARAPHGPAVLMAAQAVKGTGDYRDSTAIGHGVDVVLNLTVPDAEGPVRYLKRQKCRWPLAETVAIEKTEAGYQRTSVLETSAQRLEQVRQTVTAEWQTAEQIAKVLDRSERRVRDDLHDLYDKGAGEIERQGGGKGHPYQFRTKF